MATKVKEATNENLCGHVNKQYYNTAGRLEDLSCTLPDGHSGDHSAESKINVPDHIHDEGGRVVKSRYTQEERTAYWSDSAGTPAAQITEKQLPQLTEFQKDLLSEVLRKNPSMEVSAAVEMARSNPLWSAV